MTSERTGNWLALEIAHHLVHRAASRTPAALSERLKEEWLADLGAQLGSVARLRFAFGCCWATGIIAREHASLALNPATTACKGSSPFIDRPEDDFPFFSGCAITFVLIASLHLAVLYGLAIGLGPKFSNAIAGPFVTRVIAPPPRS